MRLLFCSSLVWVSTDCFRDKNNVQEPIRKTDFSNVSDPPKAFPDKFYINLCQKEDSCASDWSLAKEKWFNCAFIDTESDFGCITRLTSAKLKSGIPDQS